jgi:SAM-dependent methyltransferase
LDINPYPNVDVIADAHALPFPNEYFDGLLCNAVLEHTKQPWIVAKEIERVLKIGGVACVQVPFLEGVHDNEDYFRFTLKGLKSLFPELAEIKSGVSASSWQVLADLIMAHPILMLENTPLCNTTKLIMGWFAVPIQHLDFSVRNSHSMPKYARAYYFVGRKI